VGASQPRHIDALWYTVGDGMPTAWVTPTQTISLHHSVWKKDKNGAGRHMAGPPNDKSWWRWGESNARPA